VQALGARSYRSILGHQGTHSGLAEKLQQFRASVEERTQNKPSTRNAPVANGDVVSVKFSNYDRRISAIIISFIGYH
jgi:hypothetical protein